MTAGDSPSPPGALFDSPPILSPPSKLYTYNVPESLRRSTTRLQFPPSYVIVGVYRLFTDKNLYIPAWKKCQHGVVRGLTVGLGWAAMTYKLQRWFVEVFLVKSPKVPGLSPNTIFGFYVPFDVVTYTTLVIISSQLTAILSFFLYRNIRIARDRVYDLTIASRGKGPEFWQPYVEEWETPPTVPKGWRWSKLFGSTMGRIFVKLLLMPFHLVPVFGMMVSAWLRALGTARYLHQPYFKAKQMRPEQVSVFIEERKWDYRVFGFAAALLEGLPIIGLVFTVSNRIGAAMWAHDLEKRQHYVAEQKALATSSIASK